PSGAAAAPAGRIAVIAGIAVAAGLLPPAAAIIGLVAVSPAVLIGHAGPRPAIIAVVAATAAARRVGIASCVTVAAILRLVGVAAPAPARRIGIPPGIAVAARLRLLIFRRAVPPAARRVGAAPGIAVAAIRSGSGGATPATVDRIGI